MTSALQLPQVKKVREPMRRPTLGVYLDRAALDINPRAMQDCLNIRIRNKRISAYGMGRENFPAFAADPINLDDEQALLIDTYRSRAGVATLIFANQYDIFRYNAVTEAVAYMTPTYTTGTCSSDGADTEVDGAGGTLWNQAKVTSPITGGFGNNVRAGDMIYFGAADEDDPALTWYEIASVTDDTTLVLTENPGVHGSDVYTIRQRLQGDNNDIFETTIFQDSQEAGRVGEDVYYVTNGVESLSWDGSEATFQWYWPDFTFKKMLAHKQVLACWNLVDNGAAKPGAIRYSALNHPENMATNGAGELVPADGVLDLLDVRPIGDSLACYFQGDVVIAQWVDAPLYFIARVAIPGVGLLAQRAIMDFGDYHEFLSRDGVYRFDGVTIHAAMEQVFKEVLRTVAPHRVQKAYAHIDEEYAEVIWSIPLSSDGNDLDQPAMIGYVEHYLEDNGPNLPTPVTIRDWPYTAAGSYLSVQSLTFADFPTEGFGDSSLQWDDRALQQAFPQLIVGDEAGNIYILNTTNTNDGAGFLQYAHFPRFATGDGETKGHIIHVEPYTSTRLAATDYSLVVEINIFDTSDGDALESLDYNFDLTHQSTRYVPIRKVARYCDVKFWTEPGGPNRGQQSRPWELAGYEIKVVPAGNR